MKFYSQNIQDATITYSGTADGQFPIDNLNDVSKNMYFKDTSPTTGVSIKINFGAGRQCDSIVLGRFYALSSGVTCTLTGSNDDISYSAVTDFPCPGSSQDKAVEFTQATWQYWKLAFTKASGFTVLQIGNIFLGNVFEPEVSEELLNTTENYEYGNIYNETATGYSFTYETQSDERFTGGYYFGYIEKDSNDDDGFREVKDNTKPTVSYSTYPLYFISPDSTLYFGKVAGVFRYTYAAFDVYNLGLNLREEL